MDNQYYLNSRPNYVSKKKTKSQTFMQKMESKQNAVQSASGTSEKYWN